MEKNYIALEKRINKYKNKLEKNRTKIIELTEENKHYEEQISLINKILKRYDDLDVEAQNLIKEGNEIK